MTYEEIEVFLKTKGKSSVVEQLRRAVGEESHAMSDHEPGNAEEFIVRARDYYAEDISRWLDEGGYPDPTELLGDDRKPRFLKSWAIASIIRELEPLVPDDEEPERPSEVEALSRICMANAELGSRCVDLLVKAEEYMSSLKAADIMSLDRIRSALDSISAPKTSALGHRKLDLWERVEAVFEDLHSRKAVARQPSEALSLDEKRRLESERAEAMRAMGSLQQIIKEAATNVSLLAKEAHKSYHGQSDREWQECGQGICGAVGHVLGQMGYSKHLQQLQGVG